MPTSTTNFGFNKPLVNDPVDEDLWGGQLNTNWDSIDTILDALTPLGTVQTITQTTAPSSRWLLADGSAISRTTYAAYFAIVGTVFGVGDGSTTFNLYDGRGRVEVGLDNLGGSSANRITDVNADSLNATGVGSETEATLTGTTAGHALTSGENGPHTHVQNVTTTNTGGSGNSPDKISPEDNSGSTASNLSTASSGSGTAHDHDAGTLSGSTGGNVQPATAMGKIIRVL